MNRGTTSGKVHTVTSINVGLKNLNRTQDTSITFTHVDHSVVRFCSLPWADCPGERAEISYRGVEEYKNR